MLTQDQLKQNAAKHAVQYLLPLLDKKSIIGVGTGSTVDYFIDELAAHKDKFAAAVSSSNRSTERLQNHGIKVLDLNDVDTYIAYVDGADEVNNDLIMIKGGGGALTREKIVAAVAQQFICIVDDSKLVDTLGKFALPIEVIPLSRQSVSRSIEKLGVTPNWRKDYITDNQGHIIDVSGFSVTSQQALQLEKDINNIPGVISCGFFAAAKVAIIASQTGIKVIENK